MTSVLRPSLDIALAEWADRVHGDKLQVDRLREVPDGPDFYGPIASMFKADPQRANEPVLDILRGMIRADETWLDIGAGGGRYSLPIALRAQQVIAVEPSDGMLGILRGGMAEHGISNIEIHQSRWPVGLHLQADCSLISFVGNDIADIGPFVDAMERSTRRMCTFVNLDRPPASAFAKAFEHVHGEPRALLPSLPEFLALLLAKGRLFEVRLVPRPVMSFENAEQVLTTTRRQTWVREGGEKDQRLQDFLRTNLEERDGRLAFSWEPSTIGVVTWSPR